jgi:hypothetical protein
MNNTYVTIKHNGNLLKVQKAPYETEEKAYDRAWYIAKNLINISDGYDNKDNKDIKDNKDNKDITSKSWEEISSLSHIWANEKYLYMKYK